MGLNLSILYRGPLSSCNYDCGYCPFAKRRESAAELTADRAALERFVTWVAGRPDGDRIGVLFTPWGEALTRRWYRDALVRLSNLPQVVRAAAQTNLSCGLDWVEACDRSRLALWATFHPGQVARPRFLAKCWRLHRRGVRFSVGVVGLREHFADIEALRRELPEDVYLWVNAYKDRADYYGEGEVEWLTAVDPLFGFNNRRHPSLDRTCRTGHSVVSVDGEGTVRRCHFIREPLGNLYALDFERLLTERLCTNATCGCHIGYVHLDELELYPVFGEGVLERIPARPIWHGEKGRMALPLLLR
jgi:MoaA/NifB/PqqE/SkfB family radical SAM enzyme